MLEKCLNQRSSKDMQIYNFNENSEYCSLKDLPLLGQVTPKPSINDVMDRVVVSQDWMGLRFRKLLENVSNDDLFYMFRSITGIVINKNNYRSFYGAKTAAIYLEPLQYAETSEERNTGMADPENETTTPKLWFQAGFTFRTEIYGKQQAETKELIPITRINIQKLTHELIHASDFWPPNSWDNVNQEFSPEKARIDKEITPITASQAFAKDYPSNCGLAKLALYTFDTRLDSPIDLTSITPEEASKAFSDLPVLDFYNLWNIHEDLAENATAFLMLWRYGIPTDTAITQEGIGNIVWGERHRISHPEIMSRTAFALKAILPHLSAEIEAFQNSAPKPISIKIGTAIRDLRNKADEELSQNQ